MTDLKPNDELKSFLAHLTSEPGVYRMLNTAGNVLYVGKAVNLKKRVASYFNPTNKTAKTRALVSQIASIEVHITRSETEALLLESSLIKSLRPKYNVLMRDDKSYPYIHLSHTNAFPRLELIRCKKKPALGEYFGPYPSSTAARETVRVIQKVFKIRNCSDAYFSARSRPCLQYQIKRCTAPCTAYISASDYERSVKDAIRFLQGKSHQLLDELAMRMEKAVERLAFEEAAQLRDKMKLLRLTQEQQGVVQWCGDLDVIVLHVTLGFACVLCVTVRAGEVVGSASFFPSVPKQAMSDESLWEEVFRAFIAHYYIEYPTRIPRLILTDQPIDRLLAIEKMLSDLRGSACKIQMKPRGKNAKWLDFALNNLQMTVSKYENSAIQMALRYKDLAQVLCLERPIKRIECFDISHTQGDECVASCVVFDESGSSKSNYRRFNIQGITNGDDYAAMEQVITRRFKRSSELPDVLVIDGGKGQVSIAKRVLLSLGIDGVFILGIAKGPHRKAYGERLVFADERQEIALPLDSKAFHLLQQIRDEAHRFAITSHRKKRQKKSLDSTLLTIEGIGAKRRQLLMHRFGGLRELSIAPMEEIAKVRGISKELALRIYRHFH